jgi:VIT1/CCC1 family predicted Fe2+/Mn2+ transporter
MVFLAHRDEPVAAATIADPALGRILILDELFDLSLYQALRSLSTDPESQQVLDRLIAVETQHVAFWQHFFNCRLTSLDPGRRLKLWLIVLACRLLGTTAIHLVLEAIEVHGVRKYLSLWTIYKDQPLGSALRGILMDEFKHEDVLVSQLTERKINPERIRNIFLGLNDGLVEILGAVSGFFAAFSDALTVLIAALTTAVAGSISMAAGAYAALNSEQEVQTTESLRKQFLGEQADSQMEDQPLRSAVVVGGSYFLGALIPVLPVLFGAKTALVSLVTAGSSVILVSTLLAFLSGMEIRKRITLNLVTITIAVGATYGIGRLANHLWGIAL